MYAIPNRKFIVREPKGKLPRQIAAYCWYPIEADPIITMFKVRDANDEIITVKEIDIISCEYVLYHGDNLIEYHCRIQLPTMLVQEVYIHYYLDRMKWTISVP